METPHVPPHDPGNGQPPHQHPEHGDEHHNPHDHHGHHHPWYGIRPKCTWWWTRYCPPTSNNQPVVYEQVNMVYTTVNQLAPSGEMVEGHWYLGLTGTLLPGKGFGIEAIEENSPADLAGLQAGMVIIVCNDVELSSDAAFADSIAASDGVLQLQLLEAIDGEALEATVTMQRLTRSSY